ncbi:MAG: thiamine diphosphokinase [Thermotogota bacterium]|nr:thiamine diphosphokinase [Thermotogota bacterium]
MKKAALILGGSRDSSDEFYISKIDEADYLVAVDSGANLLFEIRMLPDLLIGDLDSIDKKALTWCRENYVEIMSFGTSKDETDTELALNEMYKRGFNEVQLLNALGDRPDHFLTTIYLLYSYSEKMNVLFNSENLISSVLSGNNLLDAKKGELWSILPVGENIPLVTLKGFEHEINQKKMPFNKPFGTSNVSISNKVEVNIEKGAVIYFRWLNK